MEQSSDSWKELDFAKYLYCTSSSVKVSNNFINFNARAGVSHKEGTSQIGSRSFAISGNFEADSPKDVENFRSEIFTSLFNKLLHLYLDDEDDSYYNCVLDGNVNTTYNQGYSISRVFTLSFNLIATEPYRHGAVNTSSLSYGVNKIYYEGTVPCFPTININPSIFFTKENVIPFIKCNTTSLNFKNEESFINFQAYSCLWGDCLIKNGIVTRTSEETTYDFIDEKSKLHPLMFMYGENELEVSKIENFKINKIKIIWEELYY